MPVGNRADAPCIADQRRTLFTVLVIAALVISAYANTLDASWHFDDEQNIVENRRLHLTELSPEQIVKTFFASPGGGGRLYRPVACFSFALNYYFGKDHVFGYHLVNLAVHLTTALFLFFFLCRALCLPLLRDKTGPSAPLIAALATLLWALNPVQTQAVTYIVQRMASLAAMFTIMSFYFYLRGRTASAGAAGFYLLCAVCGLLAAGSKENAAMLPVSLLLFELLLVRGASKKSVKTGLLILPLLILAPLGLALILKGPAFFDPSRFLGGYENRGFTLAQRLLTEPRIVLYYISQLLFPAPGRLSLVHTVAPSTGLFSPPVTSLSLLAVLAMIGAAGALARKRPLLSFAVLFFFLNHLVESTVFPLELVYEHRNYLPSLFFFAPPAAWLVGAADRSLRGWVPVLVFSVLALAVSGFGYATYRRNFAWKTEESLWLDALRKNPHSARVYHNLGRTYADRGQYRLALDAYRLSLEQPKRTYGQRRHVTHFNMAVVYQAMGDAARAEAQLRRSLALKPGYADACNNLALLVGARGNFTEAVALLETAVKNDPRNEQIRANFGYILIKLGRTEEAIAALRRALEMDRRDTVALENLGIAYRQAGDAKQAAACFRQVLFKNPRAVMPRLFLAEAYFTMGKNEAAGQTLELFADLLPPERLAQVPLVFRSSDPLDSLPDEKILAPALDRLLKGR